MSNKNSFKTVFLSAGILCFLLFPLNIGALENGLARTPPMGWNSWNCFGGDATDTLIRQIADAMVSSGMKAAGFTYVNMDDFWQSSRDSNGTIVADPVKFPNGMKALADYVHSKGLKLGLYSDRGTATCGGRPGSHGYETIDAATYASWGIDYLKYDNCNADTDTEGGYRKMSDALLACGRPICFSICAWGFYYWAYSCGNLSRTTSDISANWSTICNNMDSNANYAEYAGPGHWNDPDMLEVGNGSLTPGESRAHFSMWCMMASPLLAGNDLRNMTQATIDVLTNPEVIAVDQDVAGIQGTRIIDNGDLEVWCKPLGSAYGGSKAVALLNRSGSPAAFSVNWSDIGLLPGSATVRDLWAKADRGSYSNSYSVTVPSHDVVLVVIKGSPISPPPVTTPDPNGTCVCKAGCASRTVISAGFVRTGAGEFCWETTCPGNYFVSWSATLVEVNGVDCTNISAPSSSIAPSGGIYYIYFKGDYLWSHFELSGTCPNNETPAPTADNSPAPVIPTPTLGPGIPGDANGDGDANIVDALLVAQYYVGTNPAGFIVGNADVNCDGTVDIVDALRIAQYYVGLIMSLGC